MLRHIFVVQNMILCTFTGKTSRYEAASEYKKQKVGVWELIISKTEKGQKWLDGE